MTVPSFPVVAFTTASSVKIYRSYEEMAMIRLSEFMYQTSDQFVFDSHGNKFAFQFDPPPFPISFWNELRNPYFKNNISWKYIKKYTLVDLKLVFYALLDKEDEVLTEHESAKHLRELIHGCNSFNALIALLNKHVFAINETELWSEQEQRTVSLS